ncbi:hypothetical protein BOTBODRAFT_37909 [Botryobasidium botryosum FD-172 SS1]|uniref:Protein kinase domain-containing protein n=1 Tax=Botryobasidium botryosum (strain FD-172 SS1) TaxID=930990 RepID=A0A067M192_BOTB1|nr:hypothetical protein BOTBODRAFT_37909 [Botryobasidium botryosum FD-172 SS1]
MPSNHTDAFNTPPTSPQRSIPLDPTHVAELVGRTTRLLALQTPDLSKSTPEKAMQLIRIIREQLFSSSADKDVYIRLLFQLYFAFQSYPAHPALHEYEITRRARPTPSCGGGFADCWEGTFLGELKVAMKTPRSALKEVAKKRLEREIKVWRRLQHPNILPFIGCCTLEDTSYMVSPWVENGDALAYVRRSLHSCSLDLLAQVASGLQYLHEFTPPVIHGDLKSSNILVSEQGVAFITDFGLSAVKSAQNAIDSNSSAWHRGGHPRWQAPELLLQEDAKRTEATDVFAFGRVMLEFLTGEIPFSELNSNQVLLEVIGYKHPARPRDDDAVERGLDDGMWRLMQKCWSKDPVLRPVAADIAAYLQSRLIGRSRASGAVAKPWRIDTTDIAATLITLLLIYWVTSWAMSRIVPRALPILWSSLTPVYDMLSGLLGLVFISWVIFWVLPALRSSLASIYDTLCILHDFAVWLSYYPSLQWLVGLCVLYIIYRVLS